MKKIFITILGCCALGLSTITWADACETGSCGGEFCDFYQTKCQCTDPMCNKPMYSDCISRGYCCEAFGNIGAR